MAAKKKNTRHAKVVRNPKSEEPKQASEPTKVALPATVDAVCQESKPPAPGPPVVGIGASAGGLDAFKKFFTALPADSGIAFVLIPHLDPKHESLMVELIARHTSMPVVEATDGLAVLENRVYIIPPNKYMTFSAGALRLTGPVARGGPQTSIDLFLRSLAEEKQEKAICIILSGTGSHGTLGLKAVKAAGGMAMVQDPATADYPLMPQSAVATGLADYVLPAEQMPDALMKYTQHYCVDIGQPTAAEVEASDYLNQALAVLRTRGKVDFRYYRKKTLARRIERRMSLSHIESGADYVAFLRDHADEVDRLASDLLISVTSFFRDAEAWSALEALAIRPLVQSHQPDAPIRVWSVGCATGEEAYSVGILIVEQLAAMQKSCPVQIFATDLDEKALETARHGVYPDSICSDVSVQRLAQFFTRDSESSYRVSKHLREMVIFARQNVLTDAPFSKLDLVVCRNLLIYLEPEAQKRVIGLLHFGLRQGGYLFLGPSETIGRNIDLFEQISPKWRLFQSIGMPGANVQFPITQIEPRQTAVHHPVRAERPVRLGEVAQSYLLRRFGLACVVINRNYQVLHFAGPTESFLVQPPGPPTQDLLALTRQGLGTKLRGVIHRAVREGTAQSIKNVVMRHEGLVRRVTIDVEPLDRSQQTEGLLLIAFQEQPSSEHETLAEAKKRSRSEQSEMLRHLEQELETTRESLQCTIEELESSNEEHKASNEEIMSMNEELQSTNEELETSKEELQSVNEELSTVNVQLHEKLVEIEKANNDMANLLNSTDIATVFLDRGLKLKFFTPNATRMFSFIPTDIGRPIAHIAPKFTDPDLEPDADAVLHDLAPRERELLNFDGCWYLRRIVPYRTLDNRIDGVVISFVDITERKQAADVVVRRLAAVVESTADAIFCKDLDGTVRTWNQGAQRLYGYAADEIVGKSIRLAIPEDRLPEWKRAMEEVAHGKHVEQLETERMNKDGRRVPVVVTLSPIRDAGGTVVSVSAIARDVSERKLAEQSLRESERRFRLMADAAPVMIWIAGTDKLCTWFNKPWLDFVGRPLAQELGNGWLDNVHPEDHDRCLQTYVTAFDARQPIRMEYRLKRNDGEYRWFLDNGIPRLGEAGEFAGYIGSCIDITDRKQAESALRDSQERLQAILDTAADAIITIDTRGIIRSANLATERMFGYAAGEMLGQSVNMLMPSPHRERHDAYLAKYLQTGEKHILGISREVEACRKDGSIFPADLAVSEIKHLGLFTGIHRDLTERKQLEREVVEAASLEQRRIGQDLHDSVAQELTALNLLVKDLSETLHTEPDKALSLAKRMDQGLQRTQHELRAVLRGLLPVAVDSSGLMAALSDLAERTQQERKVPCTFHCSKPVTVADNLTATQLYLIAQEAVNNSLRHAEPQRISISLNKSADGVALNIQDDGVGMPASPTESQGLGLRIMRHRATIIGAKLIIEPAQPSGTVVSCKLSKSIV